MDVLSFLQPLGQSRRLGVAAPLPAEEPPASICRHSEPPDAAGVIASSGSARDAPTVKTEHGGSVLVPHSKAPPDTSLVELLFGEF